MADVHTKEVRSYNMSQIRAKNTKPELLVRKFLFSKGFRFRLNDKKLFGKPDIVLPKYKTVVFVNGCFWHSHKNCRHAVLPKSNQEYWSDKIKKNAERDIISQVNLKENGWMVIVIWECELHPKNIANTLDSLNFKIQALKNCKD